MPSAKRQAPDYSQRVKLLRKYERIKIDLRRTLSRQQKSAITRSYNRIKQAISLSGSIDYRPRSKAGRKAAQELTGLTGKNIKVYPIPSNVGGRVKLLPNKKLRVETSHVDKEIFPLNFRDLIDAEEAAGEEGVLLYLELVLGDKSHGTTLAPGFAARESIRTFTDNLKGLAEFISHFLHAYEAEGVLTHIEVLKYKGQFGRREYTRARERARNTKKGNKK